MASRIHRTGPARDVLRHRSRLNAVALAVALACGTPGAFAFGFGAPQVQSALGERLRVRVPVLAEPDVELTPECLHLIADESDPLPTISSLSGAQIRIEGQGAARTLEIESRYPVNEPLIHMTVEAGCGEPVRREFTILLDPPAAPPSAAAPAAPAPVPAPPPDLSLGMPQVFAQVGRPLAMQIPVSGSAAEGLEPACVRLTDALSGDGAPVVRNADILVAHHSGGTEIRIVTRQPVTEPAVRVAVSVGCKAPLQREYGVLLDMPAAPAVGAAPASPQPMSPPTLAAAAAAAEAGAASPAAPSPAPHHKAAQRAKTRHGSRSQSRRAAHHPIRTMHEAHASAHAGPATPAASREARAASPPPPVAPAPRAASGGDRLVLAASPADNAAAADAARMDAMTKQMAELAQQVRVLQGEIAADRARERTLTARDLALQAQLAQRERSSGIAWIAAALAAAGLAAAGVLTWLRRRGDRDRWRNSWDAVAAAAEPPVTGGLPASIFASSRAAPSARASAPASTTMAPFAAAGAPATQGGISRIAEPATGPHADPLGNDGRILEFDGTAEDGAGPPDDLRDHPALAAGSRHHRIEVVELHNPSAHVPMEAQADAESERLAALAPHTASAASGPELDLDTAIPHIGGGLSSAQPPAEHAEEEAGVPLTQLPTMLSLDLDLSTDWVPLPEPEKRTKS